MDVTHGPDNKRLIMECAVLFISLLILFDISTAAKPARRPLNIAHRGSSGVLPEHTLPAYERAIADGADFIECDCSATKDGHLICLHDPGLMSTTDVADRLEFAHLRKNFTIPGEGTLYDWFPFDFTLTQIKTLRTKQRLQEFRDTSHDGMYPIPTLEEYIDVAKTAKRPVGIYIETKHSDIVNEEIFTNGTRFEDTLVDILKVKGYTDSQSNCFLQSFSEESIRVLTNITKIRLIQLTHIEEDNSTLDEWSKYCYGVGASKFAITPKISVPGGKFTTLMSTDYIARVHARGMQIHVFTLRSEDRYLAWNYEQDIHNEYERFDKLGVDGMFTDFPASLTRYLTSSTPASCPPINDGGTKRALHVIGLCISLILLVLSLL